MSHDEVHFISKMIVDEVLELWATLHTSAEAVAAMVDIIETAEKLPKEVFSDDEQGLIDQVAAQADALVDVEYYMLNCAAKKGINMSAIFGVVHAANMAKRNPETGKFEKNAIGKIVKPPGWKAPDVEGEMGRQFREGSFGVAPAPSVSVVDGTDEEWEEHASHHQHGTPTKAAPSSPVFESAASPGAEDQSSSSVVKQLKMPSTPVRVPGCAESSATAAALASPGFQAVKQQVFEQQKVTAAHVGAVFAAGMAVGAAMTAAMQ